MSSSLSAVPAAQRRRAAAVGAVLALLLVFAGLLPWTSSAPVPLRVLALLAIGAGALLALVSWGLVRSIRLDQAEARVDAAVQDTVAESGRRICDCGHHHDPDEMHVADPPACGAADTCARDCAACVLARRG